MGVCLTAHGGVHATQGSLLADPVHGLSSSVHFFCGLAETAPMKVRSQLCQSFTRFFHLVSFCCIVCPPRHLRKGVSTTRRHQNNWHSLRSFAISSWNMIQWGPGNKPTYTGFPPAKNEACPIFCQYKCKCRREELTLEGTEHWSLRRL